MCTYRATAKSRFQEKSRLWKTRTRYCERDISPIFPGDADKMENSINERKLGFCTMKRNTTFQRSAELSGLVLSKRPPRATEPGHSVRAPNPQDKRGTPARLRAES